MTLLSPYRAWIEGRAALETFERDQIVRAREAFQSALARASDQAPPHVGLANACVMQFEATRADAAPDVAALTMAADHAREACRLDPNSGEAWATLGFVLDRVGRRVDALAASRRAVVLEPDNWRHHFRLASVGWGEERLRAALRVLTLLPGFPLAHWLAATVYVARQALGEAERELVAGLTAQGAGSEYHRVQQCGASLAAGAHRAGSCATRHWPSRSFNANCRRNPKGTSTRANAPPTPGTPSARCDCGSEILEGARAAFSESMARVAAHPMAAVALSAIDPQRSDARPVDAGTSRATDTDRAMLGAIRLTLQGSPDAAADLVDQALVAAPPGNAAWVLPVEPLLNVAAQPQLWAGALSRLRARAA